MACPPHHIYIYRLQRIRRWLASHRPARSWRLRENEETKFWRSAREVSAPRCVLQSSQPRRKRFAERHQRERGAADTPPHDAQSRRTTTLPPPICPRPPTIRG